MRDRVRIVDDGALGPKIAVEVAGREVGLCLCHRRKDRSLPFLGLERWLCARCLGILLGSLAAAVVVLHLGVALPWTWGVALAAPLVVDWGTQFVGWRESTNGLRLATGILFGLAMAATGGLA